MTAANKAAAPSRPTTRPSGRYWGCAGRPRRQSCPLCPCPISRPRDAAGSRAACISWAPDANATWDTHGGNFPRLKKELLPQLDAAVSSLLIDLSERGLLERTVVAVMGEFGRSPRVNGAGGRDHWNFCY